MEEGKSRMGVSNLCKVFAATLLSHEDDLKTVFSYGNYYLPMETGAASSCCAP
jgi:hypothetical protein